MTEKELNAFLQSEGDGEPRSFQKGIGVDPKFLYIARGLHLAFGNLAFADCSSHITRTLYSLLLFLHCIWQLTIGILLFAVFSRDLSL